MLTMTRKPAKSLNKYRTARYNDEQRASVLSHLRHDRAALAGRLENYNPALGNRASSLRKQCASAVIRLVLN